MASNARREGIAHHQRASGGLAVEPTDGGTVTVIDPDAMCRTITEAIARCTCGLTRALLIQCAPPPWAPMPTHAPTCPEASALSGFVSAPPQLNDELVIDQPPVRVSSRALVCISRTTREEVEFE
jgi:hypothetical protein